MDNKAKITENVLENNDPECEDTLYFVLKDNYHRFTIGLSDILECLKFAEMKGEIPELPKEWWYKIEEICPRFEDILVEETEEEGQ